MSTNLNKNVEAIITDLGGKENVISVSHCATRLRFRIRDTARIRKDAIMNIAGILGVNIVGKECQIIVGADVIKYYPIVMEQLGEVHTAEEEKKKKTLKDIGYMFLDFISGTMTPLIPALIGSSMIRGVLILLTQFNLMDASGSTYAILYAASNAIFYFLPIIASFAAARKLDVNPYIAACISAALMEPTFTALLTETGNVVTFLGMPVMMFSYASSLIPALLATWLYSLLWKFLEKKMPSSVAGVFNPAICLFVFVPLTAIIFGPIAYYFGNFIGNLFNSINAISPVIAGIFIGVSMNYLVITGMHWVITAICLNEFAVNGFSALFGYWWCACISYIAIALGAIFVAKNKKERSLACSCSIVAIFGGVSEPTLYTYLLRNRRYAIPMALSGAVGGLLAGLLGCRATAFSMATIFTVPCVEMRGSFMISAAVFVLQIIVGIVGVIVFVGKGKGEEFTAPISGKIIPLEEVNDSVFAEKTLGEGFAVVPNDNMVYAPFTGEVISLYPTKHAIGLKDEKGNEVLIHVGIDTVNLKGEGFRSYVREGDKVEQGSPLVEFDMEKLRENNIDPTTVVVFTGREHVPMPEYKEIKAREKLLVL